MEPINQDVPLSVGHPAREGWGHATKVGFRFVFAYAMLYALPIALSIIPGAGLITAPFLQMMQSATLWFAANVIGLTQEISVVSTGSGDTTYNYVRVALFTTVATAAALIWTLAQRRAPAYPRLHDWLRVVLRYGLGVTMLGYGMAKVFKGQFPAPDLHRLTETFGEASPMGLLWAFMGSSTAYTVFAGAAEAVGGLLLFARRTTLLGAMVVAAVMTNVVMLNFCYDVPVKLFSSHLLLMAMFLILPDAGRLARVIALQAAVPAAPIRRAFTTPWLHWTRFGLKAVLIAGTVLLSAGREYRELVTYGDLAPRPAIYGVYTVEEFVRDGETVPPLQTDSMRWNKVLFERDVMTVVRTDGTKAWFGFKLPEPKDILLVTPLSGQSSATKRLSIARADAEYLTIDGVLDDETVRATLRRVPDSEFLLTSRGFHWISEFPYNR